MQLHDVRGKRLHLTAEERAAFLAAAATAARLVRTLCAVLHDTGCRISEALALTPERVDLTGRALLDGARHARGDGDLCQHARRRGAGHRRPHVGVRDGRENRKHRPASTLWAG
jgi:integrase